MRYTKRSFVIDILDTGYIYTPFTTTITMTMNRVVEVEVVAGGDGGGITGSGGIGIKDDL